MFGVVILAIVIIAIVIIIIIIIAIAIIIAAVIIAKLSGGAAEFRCGLFYIFLKHDTGQRQGEQTLETQ